MKLFLVIFWTFGFLIAVGQDSLTTFSRPGYKKRTELKTVPRIGVGIQKTAYVELGLSRHLGFASTAYYGSFEWTPIKNIYGLKVGYEMNARIVALGLEAKYQTDLLLSDVMLTPKIGFGLMGIVNIFYGFNISFFNLPFPGIGRHQFSIVFNYNRLAFSKRKKRE